MNIINPEYLTPNEAALHCDVTLQTIYLWINGGTIEAFKNRGRWYIKRESLPKQVDDTDQTLAIARRLRHARLDKRLSIRHVGWKLNMNDGDISRYENGKRSIPPQHLSRFAALYGVSVKYLSTGHDE